MCELFGVTANRRVKINDLLKTFFEHIKLNVTPKPDTLIRIFLSIKKLDSPIEIKEQKLEHVERKGFTVVEWGGSCF